MKNFYDEAIVRVQHDQRQKLSPLRESGHSMMSKVTSIYNAVSEKIIKHLREVQKSLPEGRPGIVVVVGTTYRTSGVRQHLSAVIKVNRLSWLMSS